MSLHEQLWSWAQQLKPWQSDLVRRLCSSIALTDSEFDEVSRILLSEYGALEPSQVAPEPQAVREDQLPRPAVGSGSARILSLSSLENIGAIEPNQRIEFELRGLTVLYGDNGAGKSSYARVLKEACRASDRAIKVLPNVYASSAASTSVQGKAKIEIEGLGVAQTIERIANTAPTPELLSISVFDSGCADTYSTTPSAIAYVPQALTLFKRLADSQIKMAEIVQARIDKLSASRPQLEEVPVGTAARQWLVELSEKNSPEQVAAFASFSAEENVQLEKLRSSLQLESSGSPAKTAALLRRKIAEVKKLKLRLEGMHAAIADENVAKLRDAQQELLAAQVAVEVLMKSAPTGAGISSLNPAWKALWNAANAYCETVITEGTSGLSSVHLQSCPLCLQPLADDARERFAKFQELATSQLEREVSKSRVSLEERVKWLKNLPDPTADANSPNQILLSDLQEIENAVSRFLSSFAARRCSIERAYVNNSWEAIPCLTEVPSGELEKWIEVSESRAVELESLVQPENKKKAEAQLVELSAKRKLSERLPDLLLLLANLKQSARLRKAHSALATKGITTVQSKLMESVVTEDLRKALKAEIATLRIEHLQVKMGSRGVTGKTVVDLQLDAPHGHKLNEVLSEGEQRSLTLAFFLAEVGSGAHDGGIIFDDPVSSLDHERRELVAQRLAKEASRRQVIVFTHDIVFLHALKYNAERQGVRCKEQVIRRSAGRVGVAEVDIPWKAMSCERRQKYLREKLQGLSKLEKSGAEEDYTENVKNFLGMLRTAWEKAVEDKLLGGVIHRFNPEVHTKQLEAVRVTQQLIDAVNQGMTMCSRWVHDQASAINAPVPTVPELTAQLDKYKELLEEFKTS